jgi:uncharacterized RDD family membrane protein YckC
MSTPPGYYPAQGDPPGTVRWWDGTEWSPEPMPPPPGYDPTRHPGDERFAPLGVRIGASLLDGLISLILVIPVMLDYLGDLFDDISDGGDGSSVAVPGYVAVYGLGLAVVWFLMVAYLGGTPGKLILGLRITLVDGATTPPGLRPAALRSLPSLAAAIPVVGQLVSIGFAVASLVMVRSDPERRSAYDRIAGTRVVRKSYL